MMKVAALLWIIVGTVLAGVAMTAIVTVPRLLENGAVLIPIACGVAFLLAMPVAYLIARQIAPPSAA